MADALPEFDIQNETGGPGTAPINVADPTTGAMAKVDAVDDGNERVYTNAWMANADNLQISGGVGTVMPPSTLWDDMNAGTNGIARGTSLAPVDGRTVVYSYTGSGVVFGFLVTLQSLSTNWKVYLKIDGNENYGAAGMLMDDLKAAALYNFSGKTTHLSIQTDADTFTGEGIGGKPYEFKTSFEVSVERISNPARTFNAGLIAIWKAT